MVEYGAHITGEGGWHMVPSRLCDHGLLIIGDAAGFTINTGLVIRGMDLAIASGMAAADAVLAAKTRHNFSESSLSVYNRNLERFVMQDMKLYARVPEFMESERLYKQYAPLVTGLLGKVYLHDLTPKEHLLRLAVQSLRDSGIPMLGLIKDGIRGARAL